MALDPVSLSALTQSASAETPLRSTEGRGGTFPKVLHQLLENAAQSHENAESAVRQMALGQTDNLHEVMLQMAQADLSFRLILEIRNRLTESYQEIMKMQV